MAAASPAKRVHHASSHYPYRLPSPPWTRRRDAGRWQAGVQRGPPLNYGAIFADVRSGILVRYMQIIRAFGVRT